MRLLGPAITLLLAVALAGCSGLDPASTVRTPWPTATGEGSGILVTRQRTYVPFETPPPGPTLEALGVDFNHPDYEIVWDGPDDRVRSVGSHHCGARDELEHIVGVPDAFLIRTGEAVTGYYSPRLKAFRSDWTWTGYSQGSWQLWQGTNGAIIYLVESRTPDVAFAYHAQGCD